METKKALLVGINDYKDAPLNFCIKDARDVGSILEMREYGFDVDLLLNEQATRRNILQKLEELFNSDAEILFFYYSGHGLSNNFGSYLVTFDTDPVDIGIDLDYFRRLAQASQLENKSVVIILDCCHSGAANVRDLTEVKKLKDVTNSDINRAITYLGSGKVLIAACRPEQKSYEEYKYQNGIFTHYLIEGMLGEAADFEGKVTVANIYDYVSSRFENETRQTPVLRGDIIGRIILADQLTPRIKEELPFEEIQKIENQSRQLMNDYLHFASSDVETWKVSKYREASDALLPRLEWFERTIDKYPIIQTNSVFKTAYSTAQTKLKELGSLMEGLNTKLGTVISYMGAGTFGTVWRIKNDNGFDFAYKVYHPADIGNNEKMARFDRGYRAMEQLDHPHIVKVHKFTKCPVGFLMDYIEGANARNFVHWGIQPSEIILQLLTVAETLKHAHSRTVIHRDVKPENILMGLDNDGKNYRPYLTDFDLAWFTTATQFTREGVGTYQYAAPEQLSKPKSAIAHKETTDVFSFGQLAFYFLCKRDPVPFLSNNVYALREELKNWALEEPASRMIQLYEKCTEQRPESRIQDFREICDILYEINQLLSEYDHSKFIGLDAFARQLIFSVVGLSPEHRQSDAAFLSPSKRSTVYISFSRDNSYKVDVTLRILVEEQLMVEGQESHRDGRQLLNQRIDSVLRPYPVLRRPGNMGPFETYITVQNTPVNIDGVELCRQVLTRTLDCIDRH